VSLISRPSLLLAVCDACSSKDGNATSAGATNDLARHRDPAALTSALPWSWEHTGYSGAEMLRIVSRRADPVSHMDYVTDIHRFPGGFAQRPALASHGSLVSGACCWACWLNAEVIIDFAWWRSSIRPTGLTQNQTALLAGWRPLRCDGRVAGRGQVPLVAADACRASPAKHDPARATHLSAPWGWCPWPAAGGFC